MFNITPNEDTLNKVHYVNFDYESEETVLAFAGLAHQYEGLSDHETYKVASILFGIDKKDKTFLIPTINTTPDIIKEKLPGVDLIGDSHSSVHAEMQGLLLMPKFKRFSIITSRPPCPTCFQTCSELRNFKPEEGIFDTAYFNSRSLSGGDSMSERTIKKWNMAQHMLSAIAKKGKQGLALVNPREKNKKIDYLDKHKKDAEIAHVESPITFDVLPDITCLEDFNLSALMGEAKIVAKRSTIPGNEEACIAAGKRKSDGVWVKISASASLPPGFTYHEDQELLNYDKANEKPSYNYKMSALKRAMVVAIKEGIDLKATTCSTIPICGMLVNAVGYGVETIVLPKELVLDIKNDMNHLALDQLSTQAGIIEQRRIESFSPFMN